MKRLRSKETHHWRHPGIRKSIGVRMPLLRGLEERGEIQPDQAFTVKEARFSPWARRKRVRTAPYRFRGAAACRRAARLHACFSSVRALPAPAYGCAPFLPYRLPSLPYHFAFLYCTL